MSPTRERLAGLHVLADDDPRWQRDPVEQARAACDAGADVIQLRAKHATDQVALAWARSIRSETRDAGALFFVNDRFDLALSAGADGVHLGQEDVPPGRIPDAVRRQLLVGRSTHSEEQALAACDEPVDYVAFGPVFGTASKQSPWGARGVEALAAVVRRVAPRRVVAIGGIDAANMRFVADAGAAAAVISAVAGAADMGDATRALRHALGHSAESA
ncbi:MAG: thiamine phosphate synthase [Myxococcota bacterium]|nr:thiamine phosphate synthase [Deltaproteobacteria bacterium]MCP4240608.1 thiamine phosphate synthase [bacterium]MDP6076022.1 thiamine phosphate synthase [Myxococcota bacterium]MDP6243489.1 thiamine phosphate synthase [Myxococcota bacterium]MDP7076526.1 thiamine phosphate synthase [Myxococcota bacterium]